VSGDNPERSSERLDYRSAGVDIAEADRTLDRIRPLVASTRRPEVLSDVGSFGGLFRLNTAGFRNPVLVASTDGVGTKLRVARDAERHDVPGYDLVSHCINDILVQGAEPLFFLDYLAMGRLDAAVAEGVIRGIVNACREFGVALLGGETAEMPGFYPGGDYDLAGTIVGVVEEDFIIDGGSAAPGDVLIGLPSSGLHTNGYSLARAIVFDRLGLGVDDVLPGLGVTAADALLEPHRCYLPAIRPLLRERSLRALAHITGGGISDNLPRVLPAGTSAEVDLASFRLPPLFRFLADAGRIAEGEMLRTFNCGVGLIAVVAARHERTILETLSGAFRLGEVTAAADPPRVRYRGHLQ
jgi:phosphoribosylformylglycinamidine cyclo-ligase